MKRIRNAVLLIAILSMFAGGIVQAESDLEVPEEVIQISEELGEQYAICPELIQAICYMESRFQPDAENGGCIGIMQVSERWHGDRMERLGVTDLTDMRGNMLVAVDYLAELFEKYHEVVIVLAVYHGERGAVERSKNREVSGYVRNILEISSGLETKHGK